ncbi:MAG: hypothetical protein H7Y37_01150 [Anaerolineae bacterium]|nr:hypothetical protein [Gloeobacterales cyanobacterium ES-bin-313]
MKRDGLAVVGLLWPAAVGATPFTPTSDAQVLERLRTRPVDPTYQELQALRSELERTPRNLEVAHRAEPHRRRSALQRLRPGSPDTLVECPSPPPLVLILRATLRQSSHDFDGALAD